MYMIMITTSVYNSYNRNMDRKKSVKIMVVLVLAFFVTAVVSKRLFISNTPRLNTDYIGAFPRQTMSLISSLFAVKATPAPLPISVSATPFPLIPTAIPSSPAPAAPTRLPPTRVPPTRTPTAVPPTRTPTVPATPPVFACPTTSTKTYSSIGVSASDPEKLKGDLSKNPEVNLFLRGYGEVNQGTSLISRNGSTYGLDDKMPPQISSLFGNAYPKIVKTYIVYEWDFQNGKSLKPNPATPNYPVHVLGLQTTAGQPMLGLKAGRDIGGGNVFMVLYATKNYIMFTHSGGDNLSDGYLFYFFDFCVDPNLLAEYNRDNEGGRSRLPVIAPGQVFGYGTGSDAKIVVRDTMSFMDTRYKEDWWEYGK